MNSEQKRFNELSERVIAWADKKGILANGTPNAQFGKFLEECTELWKAIVVDDKEQIIDGVGDVAVTIIIWGQLKGGFKPDDEFDISARYMNALSALGISIRCMLEASQQSTLHTSVAMENSLSWLSAVAINLDLDWLDCLESALNIIEKRTGRMVNGTFVKDVDNALLHD